MATDAPPAPPPQAGDQTSKDIFKQARVDAGLDQPAAPPADAPPPADQPPKGADAPPADAPPTKKSIVPDDVIDPSKAAAPKVHDDVAEILAAELPKGAKKEQIESFGKLKSKSAEKVQAALDRVAELEKKIAAGDTSKAELDKLREQLTAANTKVTEIEEQWTKEAFATSPKFQAQFASREQTALDLAKTYLDGTEVKQDIIDLAAHAVGIKRLEILKDAGVSDVAITAIMPHLANYDTVQREKKAALANWKAQSTADLAEAQQRTQAAQQKRVETENKVWDQIVPKLDLLPFRQSKDNAEWNARAEQLLAEAKRRFNGEGTDLPIFAETVAKGVAYDVQQEVIDHLRTEVTNLRTENANLKSAAPGGSITGGTRDGAPVDTSKMSREQVAVATFNTEKAKAGAG